MDDTYCAVKDECRKLNLRSRRVDENAGEAS